MFIDDSSDNFYEFVAGAFQRVFGLFRRQERSMNAVKLRVFFDKIFGSRNLLKSNKSILTINIAQQLKDVVPSELHGDVKSRVAL